MVALCLAIVPMLFASQTNLKRAELDADVAPGLRTTAERMIRVCPTPDRAIRPTPTRVQPTSRQEDTLSYDNQTNVTSIGMNTAGVRWAGAVRFTPTELGPYTGWDLIAVVYYHATYTTIDDTVKIMSDTLPAAVLLSQGFTSIPGAWNRIDLTTPIPIDGVSDLWLAIWHTEMPGGFPLGAGPGPYVPEKGIWVWESGFGWYDLGPFLDYNWNIWAIVAPAGGSTGGPDDFGYEWIDSDVAGGPVFNWIEISGTGTPTNMTDDGTYWGIPFTFTFYDDTFDTVGIGGNGAVFFADVYWTLSNYPLPTSYPGTDTFIIPYWDDLNAAHANSDDVYWEIIGDQLVIEWNNVCHYGSPYNDTLKFEVILDGTNGDIVYQYLRAGSEAGSGATVGIQGSPTEPPAWYLQYSDDSVALHDSLAIRFYYTPPDHDVGCSAILSPPEGTTPAGDYDVIGRIRNYGGSMETFDVTANVYDTMGMVNVFSQTVTLTDFPVAGDSNVNFGMVTFAPDSSYYTEIYTELVGDINPANDTSAIYSTTAMTLGDIIFELDAEAATGDIRLLGVEFDGTYFYLTGARDYDSCFVYVVDTTGTMIWAMYQPDYCHGTWGWRDIAWDGVYAGPDRIDTLYASVNDYVDKFGIDLTTGTLIDYDSFPGPISPNRALAYDGDDDWFFTASFSSDCYKFDKTNPNIQQVTNPGYAFYGAAYDNGYPHPDSHWVWWHSQDDPGTGFDLQIEKMEPITMTWTGVILAPEVTMSTTGTAGGLCYWSDFRDMDVLFGMNQGTPDHIYGVFLRWHETGIEEKPETQTPLSFGFAPNMSTVTKQPIINYSTTTQGRECLKVYDNTGRLIRTLVDRPNEAAGTKSVYWNCKDDTGRTVANGVYFIRLESVNQYATHKLILIK